MSRKVAVVGYNRIPFVRQNTAYATTSIQEMLTFTLKGLVEKYKLEGQLLGEVAAGAVIKSPRILNLTRECVLSTKLDPRTPAVDLQQACDTGLETAVYIANKIALGQIEVGIAGGVDSTSHVPLLINPRVTERFLAASRGKSVWQQLKPLLGIVPDIFKPVPPANEEPRTGLSMGGHADISAAYYQIPREEQDRLAYESHQKAAKAYEEGFFNDMVVPFKGVKKDNNLRPDSTLEKLATLKSAFYKKKEGVAAEAGRGTLTAGNSTPLTDGASVVLLASEEWAKAHNLPVLAYLTHAELAAIEFVENKQDLLMAPVRAVNNLLKKTGWKLQDFDFYEIHEAFAAQVLATLKVWETPELAKKFEIEHLGAIDRNKLNVKGSSLALAHPFAATGGRLIATLAKLLNEKGSGKGLISICAAGGQGLVVVLEK